MNRRYYTLLAIPLLLLISLQYISLVPETCFTTTQITTTNALQKQLDSAPHQATIILTDQSYTQPFTITNSVTLMGEPTNVTTINVTSSPNSYAIHIATSYTTLENLIIENHGSGLYTTGIKITAPNVTIKNCTIRNTPVGIAIWADNVVIDNCVFENCEDEGIAVLGSIHRTISHTTIKNSIFRNNCDGIELQNAYHTTITNCVFTQHTHAAIDVIGRHNKNTIIDSCQISDSTVFDIYLANTENTTISDCSYAPEKLQLHQSENTQILGSSQVSQKKLSVYNRFSPRQYLALLLEKIYELLDSWEDKINSLYTTLSEVYKK